MFISLSLMLCFIFEKIIFYSKIIIPTHSTYIYAHPFFFFRIFLALLGLSFFNLDLSTSVSVSMENYHVFFNWNGM